MSRIIIFSGAGISADSGVATFRTGSTLWEAHDIDQVCNERTWRQNFDLVHRFYNDRREGLASVEPNEAHRIVASWERDYPVVNMTQNVDDLFEQAGCHDLVHLHGRLTEMSCTACGQVQDIGHRRWDQNAERCGLPRGSSVCECRKGMRPNVVFFNGSAPAYAGMYDVLSSLTDDDVVVVSGTSGLVLDIDAMLFDRPGYKIRNDLQASASSVYDRQILGPASVAFRQIDTIVRQRMSFVEWPQDVSTRR